MKKNYFMLLSMITILCFGLSLSSCSDDDDDDNSGGKTKSTLTVDGKAIEITDLEAEYDDGAFLFWVNDALSTDKRVYIQAEFSAKENISAGTDITSNFSILFQRNKGNEWFLENGYRSGSIFVKEIDNNKKALTIEFKEVKYVSNLNNAIVLNGTLSMTYTVVQYGNEKSM